MPTSHAAPYQFASTKGDTGYEFVFAAEEIRQTLTDQLNALSLGVVPLVGDLQGSGSDTVRVTHVSGLGFQAPWQALAHETDVPEPSGLVTGYDEVTLGQFGSSRSETYKQQQLTRERALTLDEIVKHEPLGWLAAWRKLYAVTGSGFSDAVGSTGTELDVDDWLALIAKYNEAIGSGAPVATLKPKQLSQLRKAFRGEEAFQFTDAFRATQRVNQMQIHPDFAGLGVDIAVTDDVVEAGGAFRGFAHAPGGIGWAVASSDPIQTGGMDIIRIPEFGIIIVEQTHQTSQTIRGFRAHSLFGMAAGDPEVVGPQVAILSQAS